MTDRRMMEVERRIQEIEQEMAQIPLWPVGGGTEIHVLSDIGGTDTVYSVGSISVEGIASTNVIEVPSATPSLSTPVAGLGIATLDGGSTVWAAIQALTERDSGGYAPDGQVALARRSIAVPITGGGGDTAPVWLIWRF